MSTLTLKPDSPTTHNRASNDSYVQHIHGTLDGVHKSVSFFGRLGSHSVKARSKLCA